MIDPRTFRPLLGEVYRHDRLTRMWRRDDLLGPRRRKAWHVLTTAPRDHIDVRPA